jgi:hypothetical protein
MVRGRVLNIEEIVDDLPYVAGALARVALADVEDHHATPISLILSGLHRERQAIVPFQMRAAYLRLEWTGQPVGEGTWSLWRGAHESGVLLELLVSVAVAGALAGERVDQWPHLTADDHFPHGRVQSSGPKSGPGAAET